MLGENVKIKILGTLSDGKLYTGYIYGYKGKNVYILSSGRLKGTVNCTVIAAASKGNGSDQTYIAAPFQQIFYEPEIRFLLRNVRIRMDKLACVYEKSCGAVVYRITERNDIKILLVKNRNGKCWTFPKGHIEQGEDEKQTALREIKEETGLNVEIEDDFRQTSTYRPYGKIRKTAVFFLARAEKSIISIQKKELDYYLWVSIDEALKLCKHKNDTNILNKVRERLHI